ncbi:hypothetical protein [Cylindrospermopsis raciborskii]|uniref:hypothetical protein n=1 Tax=Cylindrospermopsis raciborskii TaxID=77022 RepID=UPI002EDB83A0
MLWWNLLQRLLWLVWCCSLCHCWPATDGNIHGQALVVGLVRVRVNCPGFAVPPVTSAASASVAATVMTGKALPIFRINCTSPETDQEKPKTYSVLSIPSQACY